MRVDAGAFTGFRPKAVAFLRSLRAHNERAWFESHRAEYEEELRQPLAALVEEMDVRFAALAPEIVGHPRRSPFRIYRDVRFSADKSPYKTEAACWFFHADAARGAGTGTAHGGAGFYFSIGPSTASYGGGVWMPQPASLRRIRDAIDERPHQLSAVLREPSLARRFGGLAQEAKLTRMPRGYAEGHPGADLLRHRSFTVGRELTERQLFSPALPDLLAKEFETILPLVRWLNDALGLRALARR